MRGKDEVRGSLFSYVDLERRVGPDHPLRVTRGIVNAALSEMSGEFEALYPPTGRDFIPPERLLRALLLQAFFSIRSERQLVERIDFDLLFRWFVGLDVDDPVWDATTFTKNRDRLLAGEVASRFLASVLAQPKVRTLLSTEHFSADGTLLEAWASTKSFRPKDGSGPPPDAGRNGEQDFRGQKRSNDTHASTTDPDAPLYRKGPGKEAKLCFMGHALMENRNGPIVDALATRACPRAQPRRMPHRRSRRVGPPGSSWPRLMPSAPAAGRNKSHKLRESPEAMASFVGSCSAGLAATGSLPIPLASDHGRRGAPDAGGVRRAV